MAIAEPDKFTSPSSSLGAPGPEQRRALSDAEALREKLVGIFRDEEPPEPYADRAEFQFGKVKVVLETNDADELLICLPSGCVAIPATGDNVAKWLTFFDLLAKEQNGESEDGDGAA